MSDDEDRGRGGGFLDRIRDVVSGDERDRESRYREDDERRYRERDREDDDERRYRERDRDDD